MTKALSFTVFRNSERHRWQSSDCSATIFLKFFLKKCKKNLQVTKKCVPLHPRSRKTHKTEQIGAVVQLVRIPACHAGGRGFESRPHRKREHSSVGLEHLPYKQRVGGSTPSAPTGKEKQFCFSFFVIIRLICRKIPVVLHYLLLASVRELFQTCTHAHDLLSNCKLSDTVGTSFMEHLHRRSNSWTKQA